MNRSRRKMLVRVIETIEQLKQENDRRAALATLQKISEDVDYCLMEEEMALDNRPESFQDSYLNERFEKNIDMLQEASDTLLVMTVECDDMEIFNYMALDAEAIEVINYLKEVIK